MNATLNRATSSSMPANDRSGSGMERTVEIDVSAIQTRKQLHDLLFIELGFPDYYGSNWDAFNDCTCSSPGHEHAGSDPTSRGRAVSQVCVGSAGYPFVRMDLLIRPHLTSTFA